MRTLGVDIRWEYQVEKIEKYQPDSLDRLIPLADFVIVTVPHTPQTEGMWNLSRFKKMKPTAYFVNIGRGATTQIEDLTQAIENGHIAGAALDALTEEPPDPQSALLGLQDKVLLSPHMITANHGGGLIPAIPWVEEAIYSALKGEVPEYVVNEDVLPKWRERFGNKSLL